RSSDAHTLVDKPGGVFVRLGSHISDDDKVLLQAVARVVLAGNRGSLSGQVDYVENPLPLPPPLPREKGKSKREKEAKGPAAGRPRPQLVFDHGLGGFSPDGREYLVVLAEESAGQRPRTLPLTMPFALPPAPWINVVANPVCGFLVSETGAGYTWAGNSQ